MLYLMTFFFAVYLAQWTIWHSLNMFFSPPIGRTDAEAEALKLLPPDAKSLMLETIEGKRRKGLAEDKMVR